MLRKLSNSFKNSVPIPKHATSTVYVEGLPHDATEREIARTYIFYSYILSLIFLLYRYFQAFSRFQIITSNSKRDKGWSEGSFLFC